jgi:hypothetical protein
MVILYYMLGGGLAASEYQGSEIKAELVLRGGARARWPAG